MSDQRRLTIEEAKTWQPVIRELIKHENDLVNQRLGWLIQVQGLFFAALAFSWKQTPWYFPLILSVLGIATALSLGTAIALYSPAVRGLRQWWADHRPEGEIEGPDIIGLWSPSSGLRRVFRPWRALPLIFSLAWLAVIGMALVSKVLVCSGN